MEKKSDKKDPKAHQSKLSKKTEKTKDKKEDNDFQEEIKKKAAPAHIGRMLCIDNVLFIGDGK